MGENPEDGSEGNQEKSKQGEETQVGCGDAVEPEGGIGEAGEYVETGEANECGKKESSSNLERGGPELRSSGVASKDETEHSGAEECEKEEWEDELSLLGERLQEA